MPCLRQNAFVHSVHDVEADRGATVRVSLEGVSTVSKNVDDRFDWCSGPRGMMVLFLKHVHLQKVGAAEAELLESKLWAWTGEGATLTRCGS